MELLKQKKVLVTLIVILIIAAGAGAFFLLNGKSPLNKIIPQKAYYCPIDGREEPADLSESKPLAVMIENFITIRPQYGLSKACMVFEALAEGGITRFVVLYGGHAKTARIGPVRSARPYYVDIATGFDAIYAHAGGSVAGLARINEDGVDDLNYSNSKYFWRDDSRSAPHNLYTSTEMLRKAIVALGYDENASYTGFDFKHKEKPNKKNKGQVIGINFSMSSYYTSYQYVPKTNSYDRFNAHILQQDAQTQKTISPKNVVVLYAQTTGAIGPTLDIEVVGEGPALFFFDGKTVSGSWSKDSASSQFVFKDEKDRNILLNAGQTWVEVVKTETKVTY